MNVLEFVIDASKDLKSPGFAAPRLLRMPWNHGPHPRRWSDCGRSR